MPAMFLNGSGRTLGTQIVYVEKIIICYTLQLKNQAIFREHQLKLDTHHLHLTRETVIYEINHNQINR